MNSEHEYSKMGHSLDTLPGGSGGGGRRWLGGSGGPGLVDDKGISITPAAALLRAVSSAGLVAVSISDLICSDSIRGIIAAATLVAIMPAHQSIVCLTGA